MRAPSLPAALFLRTLAVIVGTCFVGPTASAQTRPRIAVIKFDDSTARSRDPNGGIGTKVADALLASLASSGTFDVVDRDHLQRIIQEQNLKMDSRFDPAGAAKLGKLANIDALIVGTVAAFNTNVGQESERGFLSAKTTTVGTVELKVTARVINVETGSIVFAPTAGVEQKDVLAEASSSNFIQGANSRSGTKDVHSALAKLTDKSIGDVAQNLSAQIVAKAAAIPSARAQAAIPAQATPGAQGTAASQGAAKVVGLQEGLVLANRGTNAGIKAGDKFSVVRVVDTGLKDPDTGKPVTRKKKICLLAISESEESVSSGQCEGAEPLAGDELVPVQ